MKEDLNLEGLETAESGEIESNEPSAVLEGNTAKYLRSDGTWSVVSDDKASVTGGTGFAYTATDPSITALEPGITITIIPHVQGGAGSTLDVNDLGAKEIRRRITAMTGSTIGGSLRGLPPVGTNWISEGKPLSLMYDGEFWISDLPVTDASSIYGQIRSDQITINDLYTGDMTLSQFYLNNIFTCEMNGKVPGSHSGYMYVNFSTDKRTLSFGGNVYFDKANDAWQQAVRVPGLDDSFGWWIKTGFKAAIPNQATVFYGVGFGINSPSPDTSIFAGHFNNTRVAVGTDGYIYVCPMVEKPANAEGALVLVYTGRVVTLDGYHYIPDA